MSNSIKVFIGDNMYNDWNDESQGSLPAVKQMINVGDIHHVSKTVNTNTNRTTYDFAFVGQNEGINENNSVSRNLGDYRVVKISGQHAVCEPAE